MKRKAAVAVLIAAGALLVPGLSAQNPVADAERQQHEERYQNLSKRMELLEESIAAHQKTVQSLTDEVRKLKDELDRSRSRSEGAASQDSLKRLQDAIVEVDKKRQADGERIARSFEDLRKLILKESSRPVATPGVTPAGSGGTRVPRGTPGGATTPGRPTAPPPPTGDGYHYSIKSGDTLSSLVKALRAEGHKVTEKMVMDANPGVNWNRLRIGQQIFIPKTS
jgi:LysM repeat protein